MKRLSILINILWMPLLSLGQMDTIYHNNEKLPCCVKEITEDAVKFVYPDENVLNSMYKNAIQKIVFKNGRIQQFAESTFFKRILNVRDYENVSISYVESEVKGLFKLGDVSAKAKGTTELSNQERVKRRAYRKMKIMAAMMGANVVFLTNQRTEGNKVGYWTSQSSETNLTGVAYNNVLPDFNDFEKLLKLNANKILVGVEKAGLWGSDSDMTITPIKKVWSIESIVNENGLIIVNKYFRVVGFDDAGFNIYYKDKSTSYNVRIIFEAGEKSKARKKK